MVGKTTGGMGGIPGVEFAAGLNEEARKAAVTAFDAMQKWREDVSRNTDQYTTTVFDKMAEAARAMGWPDNLIEASRQQFQQVSKLQINMIDQIMDTWKQQIKSPGSAPTAMPFQSAPTNPAFSMPHMEGFSQLPQVQMWMQAAEMWQKSWQTAMSQWADMQRAATDPHHRK